VCRKPTNFHMLIFCSETLLVLTGCLFISYWVIRVFYMENHVIWKDIILLLPLWFYLLIDFWDRISLCSSAWPQMCNSPASTPSVTELQTCVSCLFLLWVSWWGLSVHCWTEVVRVSTLAWYWILEENFSIFSMSMILGYGPVIYDFIVLTYIPSPFILLWLVFCSPGV
jgi:hypothetical protein